MHRGRKIVGEVDECWVTGKGSAAGDGCSNGMKRTAGGGKP